MIIYIHPKCTTCQKMLRVLEAKQLTFTIKDIVKEPPTKLELIKMLAFQKGNIKKLFNTSGIHYREMGLSQKMGAMSQDELLELLSSDGMLVKRPFLLGKDFGVVGFTSQLPFEG